MPAARRSPVVTLMTLLHRQFPGLDDPARLIKEGAVLVDGVPAISPRTRVRADASIRIRHPRPLRGTIKLAHALAALGIDVGGAVALDLGAAAGGFTQALLDAGAARVYAVDVGTGQLRGSLRADPRVVNLERTNLARLGPHLIGEPVDLITMDLSYLAIADAIGQVDRRLLAPGAQLIALVKPTFELHAATLADQPQQVRAAVRAAARALRNHGWDVLGQQPSPIRGARGAVEMLLHARQRPAGPPARSPATRSQPPEPPARSQPPKSQPPKSQPPKSQPPEPAGPPARSQPPEAGPTPTRPDA